MKRILALVLALVLCLSLAACGGGGSSGQSSQPADTGDGGADTDAAPAADIKVAMITDYGDITDQSFNQTTYEACKAFAEANGIDFTYFKPSSDSDEDRVAQIEAAIDQGYNVVVMPGYAFGKAIESTAADYPDITFIALDVGAGDFSEGFELPSNLYSAVYQEELCGYMAGYAAVKLGYTKLGYLGGMAVPAVQRYGYGFVQGADAAAAELGLTDVSMKYAYGNQFYGDADITAAMDTWYADGVQVVFACGGGIYSSAAEAAAKKDGKVIGVDVDQAGIIDGQYGDGMTVTSAMKGLGATVNTMLQVCMDGNFSEYGGKIESLGLVSDVPEENYVQLSPSTQFADGFTADDYADLVIAMHNGDITVSNDITKSAADFATVISVDDQGNIK